MAIASSNEVENQLRRAFTRNYISEAERDDLTAAVVEIRMMLYGLRKKLKPRNNEG